MVNRLRICLFAVTMLWLVGAVVAQSPEVLAERISQHDSIIRGFQALQLPERLTRLETQMGAIEGRLERIESIGLAVAGSIFLLLADKLVWLLGKMRGQGRGQA